MSAFAQRSYLAFARIDALRNEGLNNGWAAEQYRWRARESRRPAGCFRNSN